MAATTTTFTSARTAAARTLLMKIAADEFVAHTLTGTTPGTPRWWTLVAATGADLIPEDQADGVAEFLATL